MIFISYINKYSKIILFYKMTKNESDNNNIIIKKVTEDDLSILKEISINTFCETFSKDNKPEDTQKYIETNFTNEKLLSEIRTVGSQFFIAFFNNKLSAYLKLNTGEAQTEKQGNESLEIQRIYVLSEFQGKRIGSLLMEKSEEEAKKMNIKRIWLGVWEHNKSALAFYNKKGFKRFGEHVFMFGNEAQTDYLLEKFL